MSNGLPTPIGSTKVAQALANDLSINGKWNQITFADDTVQSTAHVDVPPEGIDVLSTGETGAIKFLREDGDNSSSWQVAQFPRGHLSSLILSNNGSDADHDIDIAEGECRDSTNTENLVLSATTKRIDATWAVGSGNGGLDTGTVANDTWYHVWVIKRTDTGVVDSLFSLNATVPTMPTNYNKKRRIGSVFTNGTANIIGFSQVGDEFLWDAIVNDYNIQDPGVTATTRTLTVPSGIIVIVIHNFSLIDSTPVQVVNASITSLDQTDIAPTTITYTVRTSDTPITGNDSSAVNIRTNVSSQIRTRLNVSDIGIFLEGITVGWIDTRGRDD